MLPHEAKIRAGTATEDVTPDGPVEMSGYGARDGPSTGINDSLMATALVIDDGASIVGLVSVDLLNVSRELTSRVRQSLAADGIDLDELFLAATHTHAGPYVPARALDISPPLKVDTDVTETVETIESGVVRALTDAFERREPASIRVGHAHEDDVSHNRRASGGVGGNVRMPNGPIDPEVTALLVETASGEQTAVYNFACHPTCTNSGETLISADWPGYARRRIKGERGDIPVLFLNGAAGDINPRDLVADPAGKPYEYMDRVGTQIGDAVLRALDDAESADGNAIRQAPIRTDGVDVRFPVKSTPPATAIRERLDALNEQLERLERDGDEVGHAKVCLDRHYVNELLAIATWDAQCLPNRIPYLEVGDIGVLGMPGEVFVRHGLDLKRQSWSSTLITAGYVNDYVGYVPTLGELENVGYEVRTTKIAPDAIIEFREAAETLVGKD